MLDLSNYITGLLFIHDCVILPGFGGFVANYNDAVYDESSNTFSPPSKKLLFNSNLSYNDGLLINYLSRQKGISYEEADQLVKQSVEDAWIRLEKGETLKFDGIGTFRYNDDGTLNFNPQLTENLLTDSYGLFSFRFPPLSYQTKPQAIINNDNIRRMPTIEPKTILRYAAILVPVAVLIGLIPVFNQHFSNSASVAPVPVNTSVSIEDSYSANASASSVEDAIESSTDKRSALFYNEAVSKENAVVSHQKSQSGTFYIIGGSYAEKSNADKLAKTFEKEGFESEVICTDNLYRVSLAKFDDKVKALHELRRIRANEKYGNAWLFTVAK